MNQPKLPVPVILLVCKFFYYLLPILVAWLCISLMSVHMKYHDIGINPGANNGFLLIVVAPALTCALYVAAVVVFRMADRVFKSPWAGIAVGSAAVLVLGLAAFLFKASLDVGELNDSARSSWQFINYYLIQVGVRAPNP